MSFNGPPLRRHCILPQCARYAVVTVYFGWQPSDFPYRSFRAHNHTSIAFLTRLLEIAHLLKKADLVVLSQVDRRLHALVEPLIWRELPSLVPLLQLLPPGYFFIEDIELVRGQSFPGEASMY